MRYYTKSLCLTFNKDIMQHIKHNMNMTKARLNKALKTNNQTRKKFKVIKSDREQQAINKKKLLHTNSIKNHNKQFNLRNNTIKNFNR
jgi:hypothetical protein